MKRYLPFLLLMALPALLHAQLMDRIIRKTQEKVEESAAERISDKAAEKADEQMENLLNSIFPASEEGGSSAKGGTYDSAGLSQMMAAMTAALQQDVQVPESYSFALVLDVLVQEEGEEAMPLTMMFGQDNRIFAVRTQEGKEVNTMIFDGQNNLTCILQEDKKGNKTGLAMGSMGDFLGAMPGLSEEAIEAAIEENPVSIKKTGKTKTVAGYACDEYEVQDNDQESLIYVTDQLELDYQALMQNTMGKSMPTKAFQTYSGLEGTFLEARSVQKEGGLVTTWITQSVDTGGQTLKTTDYTFTSLSGE
jgi:histone H3/H4